MLGRGEGLCVPPMWLWDLAEVVWGVLGGERDATVCLCVQLGGSKWVSSWWNVLGYCL